MPLFGGEDLPGKRNADGSRTATLTKSAFGIGIAVSADCVVSSYSVPGGPAEKAGIPLGAKVLAVNGREVSLRKEVISGDRRRRPAATALPRD